ncbi:MAG: DNA adenine methylase [Methanosarcinaceae archaeon]|nr:DNA adenine methylase [Methanosarcinaceae archaeon]
MDKKKFIDNSWDYKNDDTKLSNHGFHTYPAMMIPQVARRLIETYGQNATVLLDPFMGSGTTLLEAKLHDNFQIAYGVDINPLTRLISKVKTTPIDEQILRNETNNLINRCSEYKCDVLFKQKTVEKPKFHNIEYWFKPEAIIDLVIIKTSIDSIRVDNKKVEDDLKDFFRVAFSETVRRVSNTRNGEFKLYRMNESALKKYTPDTLGEFEKKVRFNVEQMALFNKEAKNCEIRILAEDSRFKTSTPSNSIDIIVTSPPYGDSRTTVAYGQFSRLSLEWLGFDSKTVREIDKISLGGIPTIDMSHKLDSPSLQNILNEIQSIDSKRAKDVLSFYIDFNQCVIEIDRVMKIGGFLCFVVGNRTVKGVKIPTDDIIVELFKAKNNYKHHKTIIRNIPSKRMPKKNSPTNVKGELKSTMNEEYVVILEKQ